MKRSSEIERITAGDPASVDNKKTTEKDNSPMKVTIKNAIKKAHEALNPQFPDLTFDALAAGVRWAVMQDPDQVPEPKPIEGGGRLFKMNEAAKFLGVSPRTMFYMLKEKRLTPVRLGKKHMLRFSERDLAALTAGKAVVARKRMAKTFGDSDAVIARRRDQTRAANEALGQLLDTGKCSGVRVCSFPAQSCSTQTAEQEGYNEPAK